MHVFITGATGWIGSATVDELLTAGHKVTGLARSPAAADALEAKGAAAARGDLDDLDALRRGAGAADAVVHLANKHDWADPQESDRADRAAIGAMAAALAGSDRPLVVVDGLSALAGDRPVLESDVDPDGNEHHGVPGVRTIAVRFAPSVHGHGDWGFVQFLADAARRTGVSAYLGDGSTPWSAVHRGDAARLLRLGLESAPAGARLHAVAEESIPTRAIAEALGQALDLPVASVADPGHFGFVGGFFGLHLAASSAATRTLLGWHPTGPGLLDDIRAGAYTA
ncbi:NAD-dependent epimerase/dehydratase family protein [Dactylosporangium matsuzakiense]|uniref:Oxidoreductase n=1 Tax=Dactylosporangium matsuzakiense TaxID=53360 RepID=A0A9W6KL09_9ACTN|nr:NAD-dependent epimerase/dehydratase family protein [Dactylosporangium matsuzakiense]UWZ48107.1 NAD(P)H-binding protein [Dactylosporangium matsuzakiense]GLL03123.1 oxidoreductase [Dactylosporangium matsuzakiense]